MRVVIMRDRHNVLFNRHNDNVQRDGFFDRIDESDRLRRFLAREEGALACLYGRRRIGKSRLLEEVLKARAANLPFVKDYENVVTRLFVAEGGVADAVSLAWLDG